MQAHRISIVYKYKPTMSKSLKVVNVHNTSDIRLSSVVHLCRFVAVSFITEARIVLFLLFFCDCLIWSTSALYVCSLHNPCCPSGNIVITVTTSSLVWSRAWRLIVLIIYSPHTNTYSTKTKETQHMNNNIHVPWCKRQLVQLTGFLFFGSRNFWSRSLWLMILMHISKPGMQLLRPWTLCNIFHALYTVIHALPYPSPFVSSHVICLEKFSFQIHYTAKLSNTCSSKFIIFELFIWIISAHADLVLFSDWRTYIVFS